MTTGDRVLMLLAAKLVCCLGLALAGAGLLGGAGAWLLGADGSYVLGGALAAVILWVAFGRHRSARRSDLSHDPDAGADGRTGGTG